MRLLISLGLSLLLAGCAASSSGYYTQSAQSWRGGSATDLINSWGKPTTTIKTADGKTVYTYRHESYESATTTYSPSIGVTNRGRSNSIPVMTAMPNANSPMNRGLMTYCQITLTANAKGVIVATATEGNSCNNITRHDKALANPKRHQAN